jgi:hypothetical protein
VVRFTYMDVVLACHHFKVNYDPMVFRLRNLGLVSKDEMDTLRQKKDVANDVRRSFGLWDDDDDIEAYRREEISASKLRELAQLFDDLPDGPESVLDYAEAAVEE